MVPLSLVALSIGYKQQISDMRFVLRKVHYFNFLSKIHNFFRSLQTSWPGRSEVVPWILISNQGLKNVASSRPGHVRTCVQIANTPDHPLHYPGGLCSGDSRKHPVSDLTEQTRCWKQARQQVDVNKSVKAVSVNWDGVNANESTKIGAFWKKH